jgi:hypothetical protein
VVDRSSRNDDTSNDNSGNDSSLIRRRPATRFITRESRNRRGRADTSTILESNRNGDTRSSSTTSGMVNINYILYTPPYTARQYYSQAYLRGLRYSF